MTTERLEAGRELDALVAEKVMGWQRSSSDFCEWLAPGGKVYGEPVTNPWSPSTDIAAAWLVISKMRDHGWPACLIRIEKDFAHVEFCQPSYQMDATKKELPLAICSAALAIIRAAGG